MSAHSIANPRAIPRLTGKAAGRFWSRVSLPHDESGCMVWLAARSSGYGVTRVGGAQHYAHRVAYGHAYGQVPKGLVLDHLCRNRACVRPDHLQPVPQYENTRRGLSPKLAGARNAAKTHCPKGHPYDSGNTYITTDGRRRCRECGRIDGRARYWRTREAQDG